jgi:ribosome biogenesis protein BRX1
MKRKLSQLQASSRRANRNVDDEHEHGASNEEASASEDSNEAEEDADLPEQVTYSERDVRILDQRNQAVQAKRGAYVNKQRVLVLSSRGVTTRNRHFMEDIRALLPHHRSEVKHDTKKRLHEMNEICEMKGCNGCLFFEVRKHKDLFLWATRAPNGPSLKFLVTNVHTMDELRLTGNCLHGSRPVLSFSPEFDSVAHLSLCREILSLSFGTPRGHPKSKPFVDRVMQFSFLDGRIWVRNYQIVDKTTDARETKKAAKLGEETASLVEIGPRFVLTLVKVFEGGFGGRPLYENAMYQSPNTLRALAVRGLGNKYAARKTAEHNSRQRHEQVMEAVPEDPLANVFR